MDLKQEDLKRTTNLQNHLNLVDFNKNSMMIYYFASSLYGVSTEFKFKYKKLKSHVKLIISKCYPI